MRTGSSGSHARSAAQWPRVPAMKIAWSSGSRISRSARAWRPAAAGRSRRALVALYPCAALTVASRKVWAAAARSVRKSLRSMIQRLRWVAISSLPMTRPSHRAAVAHLHRIASRERAVMSSPIVGRLRIRERRARYPPPRSPDPPGASQCARSRTWLFGIMPIVAGHDPPAAPDGTVVTRPPVWQRRPPCPRAWASLTPRSVQVLSLAAAAPPRVGR